jgi:hypothetical protein
VTDTARKVVFARIGERLRVAGMVEIVGRDTTLDPARIASLRRSTQQVFAQLPLTGARCIPGPACARPPPRACPSPAASAAARAICGCRPAMARWG